MHIVVCVKQVPDSSQIRVHPVTNTIMRQGVPAIINPYDLFALEQALRLRDRYGGEVTAITMGPPMAEDALRKVMTFGANRAVLLTDRQFAGSDTLATSYALAAAIKRIGERWGEPSVVLTGKQTIDGDTAQVGPGIAKRLGLTQLTYVSRVVDLDPATGQITLERRAEGGAQMLLCRLPVLITMLEGTSHVRRGSIGDALRAARAEVIKWSAADAGVEDATKCGLRGSPTIVKSVFAPSARAERAHQIATSGCTKEQVATAILGEIFTRLPHLEAGMHGGATHG